MFKTNVNFNLYKTFYEVAKSGSISAASKTSYVSQPAISRAIKKLEDELNVKLFYRNLNGTVLTSKGKELLFYIEEAFNSLITAERSMVETDDLNTGKLSIGVPSHIGTFYIFENMEKFHNLYPNIEISIVSRSTTELLKLLESHEIDFIIDSSPIDPIFDNLIIKPLTVVPNCFVARTDSKIIPKKVMKQISDIKDLPLILPVRRSTHRKELEKVAFEANIQFSNVISIETSEMIIGAVEKDLGIAYVIYDLVKKDIESGILRKIDIKEKLPTITINLVYIEKFLTRVPLKFIEKFLTTDIKETVTEK